MSTPRKYVVMRSLKKPGISLTKPDSCYRPGELLPDDFLTPEEITSLLKTGGLRAVGQGSVDHLNAKVKAKKRTPWTYDPDRLKGKSLEQLLTLINEADDSIPLDSFDDEREAITFLSQDWDGEQSAAPDYVPKTDVARLSTIEDGDRVRPSVSADAGVEKLRALASPSNEVDPSVPSNGDDVSSPNTSGE